MIVMMALRHLKKICLLKTSVTAPSEDTSTMRQNAEVYKLSGASSAERCDRRLEVASTKVPSIERKSCVRLLSFAHAQYCSSKLSCACGA
jgi:hypothetical protein